MNLNLTLVFNYTCITNYVYLIERDNHISGHHILKNFCLIIVGYWTEMKIYVCVVMETWYLIFFKMVTFGWNIMCISGTMIPTI
jgi:hypothetical protein